MFVVRIHHPFFAYPANLRRTPLEHSLIALVAGHLGVRESEVGYEGRPQTYPYDAVVVMPFPDGRVGLNDAIRVNLFTAHGFPAFVIFNARERAITLPDLREFETRPDCGLFSLRLVGEGGRNLLRGAHPDFVVPRDETLRRLAQAYDAGLADL